MNKQKEIDEIAPLMCYVCEKNEAFGKCTEHGNDLCGIAYEAAEYLLNAGYRLESEVRKETAKEIYEWIKGFMEWDEEGVCRALAEAYDIEVEE